MSTPAPTENPTLVVEALKGRRRIKIPPSIVAELKDRNVKYLAANAYERTANKYSDCHRWFKAPVLKFAFPRFVQSRPIPSDVSLSAMTGLSIPAHVGVVAVVLGRVGDHFGDHSLPGVHAPLTVRKTGVPVHQTGAVQLVRPTVY